MNHIYKTLWSAVHQQYVVTNEKQASHGKPSKSVLTAVVASAVMAMAGNAIASGDYVEPGKLGDAASWETQEYKVIDAKGNSPWSLKAMNASSAYALGFHGQGVHLGVMDSGALITHEDFESNRIKALEQEQTYGSNGCYYPQNNYPVADTEAGKKAERAFTKGETHKFSGAYNKEYNDSHGTKVTGAIAASRNGVGMHGVAWGANVTVGNTYGNDSTNYGPFLDYEFFKKGWSDLADKGVKVINNSFGTNIKRDLTEVYPILKATKEEKEAFTEEQKKEYNLANFANYYNSGVELTSIKDIEYEYFLFQERFGGNTEDVSQNKSFVDGAWEAVKDKDTIQVMTAGNNWRNNPYHRALYPYFHPEAEGNWISISAIAPDPEKEGNYVVLDENYNGADRAKSAGFNRAGYAKYWTLCSGGQNGYTTTVSDPKLDTETNKEYDRFGGTSMAAPLVTGAFGVLMSRYPDMSAKQVRDILFTTASHTNPDGSLMKGWGVLTFDDLEQGTEHVQQVVDAAKAAGSEFTPKIKDGEVDVKMGWGVPDLNKGMFGPGQLLGRMDYKLDGVDVWSNDISEIALEQRYAEEKAWLDSVTDNDKVSADKGGDYKLKEEYPIKGIENSEIDENKAKAWRQAYFEARAAEFNRKVKEGLWNGSLVKDGEGTLVMLGENSYKGGTTVKAGSLYGAANSFGDVSAKTEELPNAGKVVVEGGTFGITPVYVDQLTLQGRLERKVDEAKAAVEVKKGGTLDVLVSKKALEGTGETAKVASLNLEEGATVRLSSLDWVDAPTGEIKGEKAEQFRAADPKAKAVDLAKAVAQNEDAKFTISGAINSTDEIVANAEKLQNVDYIGVKQEAKLSEDKKTLTVTLLKKTEEELAAAVKELKLDEKEQKVFDAIGMKAGLTALDGKDAKKAAKDLTNDNIVNAQTAVLMNNVAITNAVIGHASGFGHEKQVKLGEGTIWGNAIGSWGKVKLGEAQTKTDYYTALIGGDMNVTSDVKLGGFVGYGHGNLKADEFGKTKTNDFHAGLYANAEIEKVAKLTGGMIYTHQKRDMNRVMGEANSNNKFNTNIVELFAEAACPGFSFSNVNVEPYVGMNWIHFQGKDIEEDVYGETVKTSLKSQNVYGAGIGVRADVPFSVGSVAMTAKGDVAYKHFFGDKPAYDISVKGASTELEGKKLSNIGTVSLGVDAQLSKAAKAGLSFEGAYGNKVHSNGVMANFTYNF